MPMQWGELLRIGGAGGEPTPFGVTMCHETNSSGSFHETVSVRGQKNAYEWKEVDGSLSIIMRVRSACAYAQRGSICLYPRSGNLPNWSAWHRAVLEAKHIFVGQKTRAAVLDMKVEQLQIRKLLAHNVCMCNPGDEPYGRIRDRP